MDSCNSCFDSMNRAEREYSLEMTSAWLLAQMNYSEYKLPTANVSLKRNM